MNCLLRIDRMPARKIVASGCAVALCLALGACGSSKTAEKLLNPDPPDKMYAVANSMLTRGRYEDAAHKFEDLDRDHPYSQEARRSIVMAAFAYYKANKFPEAITTAKRYTTMHPGTKEAPLAHHIIASSYFDDMNGPDRDQSNTREGAGGVQDPAGTLSRQQLCARC